MAEVMILLRKMVQPTPAAAVAAINKMAQTAVPALSSFVIRFHNNTRTKEQ
jgi:hypothetical protein